jgi:fermentation-respiration switch protein FrsA (DUF1100 family)
MEITRATWTADGLELIGILRVPDRPTVGTLPALAFTGPFTGVKEQVTGIYAERLAHLGFVTPTFDHRGFGESGGRRLHEDPTGKLSDLRSAVSFLALHPAVDESRIGLVGVCLGGGYALRAAAFDPRVRAVAGVAGAYNSPAWFRQHMGTGAYRRALAGLLASAQQELADGTPREVAAVSADADVPAAMPGPEPYAYYGTKRSASPHWINRVTQASLYELMTLDTASAADLIAPTPFLVIHGRTDEYCSPEAAQAVFDRAGSPKEIVWLDTTNHIDLYDTEPYVGQAVEALAAFFSRHL